MFNKLRKNLPLILIVLLAFGLRLWQISQIPPSLTPDEAALGFNAYSILKTGKDEYGKFLPIIFKSFGDFKPGLYIYLSLPFIFLFGLNEFSIRILSVIAGTFSVYLVYKIVQIYLSNELNLSENYNKKIEKYLPLLSSFLLAINPWHIFFSRGAWEVNLSLTFTLIGIKFFLKSLKKEKFLIYSTLFFSLTLITYQGAKLSTAIVVILLALFYWKDLLKFNKKTLIFSLLIPIVISVPILLSFTKGETGRLNVFSVFSYPRPTDYLNNFLMEGGERIGSISYYLFHSESLNFARGVFGRWFNHFSARFLFFEGDWQNPQHQIPYLGQFLLLDAFLILLGLYQLFKNFPKKFSLFIFFWLILSPLAGALSRDSVQAVRSLNEVIPLIIIESLSLIELLNYKSNYKKLLLILFSGLYLANLVYFFDAYFIHLRVQNAKYWYFGYKEVVIETSNLSKNNHVIFEQSYAQPYIYFLFYGSKSDPEDFSPSIYQKHSSLSESLVGDVGLVNKIGNIDFVPFSWPAKYSKGTVIVGDAVAIPSDFDKNSYKLINEIYYPGNKEVAFKIIEVK